jgi:hypothetical protein
MPSLLSLIKNVRDVNVLVISRAQPALQGTPFDTNIAAVVRRKRVDQEKAQKPFITALAARGGSIVSGGVVIAGEAILLPERPATILAAKGTNSLSQRTNATATLNSVPSSSGQALNSQPGTRDPESPPPTTVTLTPQTAPPPKPKVFEFVTRTNAVATDLAAAPASTSEKSIPKPESRAAGSELSWTGPDLGIQKLEPGTVTANSEPATRNPEPRQRLTADATPPSPIPAAVAGLAELLDPKPVPVAARSPAANAPSAVAAVVEAPTPGPSAALLLTIGIVLLTACLGLLLVVVRMLRPRRQGSFITQSMESR